jgi:hypothetical protein
VKTAAGLSDRAEVIPIVSQGKSGAALVRWLDVAQCLESYFTGSQEETKCGRVKKKS